MDLTTLQEVTAQWRDRNFPDADSTQQLLGVVEEVGELSHHHLKKTQGIRGTDAQHMAGIQDSVGDIIIYLAGFCSKLDISLDVCVRQAWSEVRDRNWVANPTDGKVGE